MFQNIALTGLALLFIWCGYNVPTVKERFDTVSSIAKRYSLHAKIYKIKYFDIFSYSSDLSKYKQKDLKEILL